MKTEKKPAAFFGVDGTLFRTNLLLELMEELLREGVLDKSARAEYAKLRERWIAREGTYEAYFEAATRSFAFHMKGIRYHDVLEASRAVRLRCRTRVHRFTRDLMRQLKRDGYYLIAISHSPKVLLDTVCRNMGFDKIYGKLLEMGPTERLTGVVVDEHIISNKANIVRRAVDREKLTLVGSVGVGDTERDIPFLELLERPICFNPNARLYSWARRTGAQIVVERKDMIYSGALRSLESLPSHYGRR